MSTVSVTCPRCDGTGRVPRFGYYAQGLCFRCGGAGTIKMRAHRDGSVDHDHRLGYIERDRCVIVGCGLPVSEWPPVVPAKWFDASQCWIVYFGGSDQPRFEGTRRKAQNAARRAILERVPNARIKWVAA